MKTRHLTQKAGSRRRGTTIFVALVTIGIMSVTVVAMLQYALYQKRMSHRRVEREAVYYAAEAGIDQVVHYFNFPTEYTDPTLFSSNPALVNSYYVDVDLDGEADTNIFSLRGITGGGTELDISNASPLIFGLDGGDDYNRAQVTDLRISLPTAEDLAFSENSVLVVTSQAQNANGQTRIVRATLTSEPPFVLRILAPLISLSGYDANGHLDVNWGEAWFEDDFSLPNGGVNNLPAAWEDPWFNIRSEGTVLLSNDTPAPLGSALDPSDPNYLQPWGPDELPLDPDHTNIYQHATPGDIPFPDPLDYEFWKDVAQARGLYFSWNEDGTSLVQGTGGAEISDVNFLRMINSASEVVIGANGESQILPAPQIVFVDTLDGNPPAADGSNLCDLKLTGGGEVFLRGVVYIAGDVTLNVSGKSNIWIQDPDRVADPLDGSEIQETIFMNGLFYCEGVMETSGSQGVYGALFTRGGYGGSGGPEVWYDARLRDGLPFSFNSAVTVARVIEYSPDVETTLF